MEPCSSHHWHHSDWPNSVREPGLAATFPALSHTHTHTALFYLSGCCLLSFWLGSLCLSVCPPHKPNNATLLRLLRALASRPVEKEEEDMKRRKGKGKSEEKRRPHMDAEAVAEIRILASGFRGWEGIILGDTQHNCTHKVFTLLESVYTTTFITHKSLQASSQYLRSVGAY